MPVTILYRGHKDEDFRKTNYKALCFFDSIKNAIGYGLGLNDSGNVAFADGYVTTVEFHGNMLEVSQNGLAQVEQHIGLYSGHEAVKFQDGVIAVIDCTKLRNPKRVKASDLKP